MIGYIIAGIILLAIAIVDYHFGKTDHYQHLPTEPEWMKRKK